MSNNNPEAARSEYDFSGGVRGKYADRFARGIRVREVGSADAVAEADAAQRVAQTLAASQELELTVALFLAASARWEPSKAVSSLRNALHHSSTSEWESLLRRAAQPHAYEQLAQQLDQFAKQKEWLVHSCFVWLEAAHHRQAELESTFNRLEELTSTTATLHETFRQMLHSMISKRVSADEFADIKTAVSEAWMERST
jgi:hypothetical protein